MTRPTPPSVARARSRTGAIIALILGAILTISGPVLGVLVGSLALVPSALSYADSTTRLAPTGTVELDPGKSVFLLAPVADLEHADHQTCRAHTGNGVEATVTYEPASALNTLVSGTRYESFGRVTATARGEYTITCEADVDVVAAPPFHLFEVFGPLARWTAGGIALSLIGVIGMIGVIVGIVGISRARQRHPVHTSGTASAKSPDWTDATG
ncbi:hypothetical protein [Polymorphospora rubra]|uniref:hypothetical protein n=1 Tax=Polymorphospora rubra TaxID=338584 RepID=UPI0033C28234